MFWKEFNESKQQIKNPWDLKNIPNDKIFVSQSGYAYNLDDIIFYFQGKGKFFEQDQKVDQISHVLKDYLNRNFSNINLHVFTPNDLKTLIQYPPFKDVIEEDKYYETYQDYASVIQEDTLQLIRKIAEATTIMENPKILSNDDQLGLVIGGPIQELYSHLTKNINEYPESERAVRNRERHALKKLTGGDLTSYALMRGKNLVDDLTDILTKKACSANFNRHIANLYTLIVTYKNYAIALENVYETKAQP